MRGQILDLIMLFVIIGIIFAGLVFGSYIYTKMEDKFPNNQVANTSKEALETTFSVFDYGIMFIMIGLGMSTVISAFFIKTHPMFFIASIMILAIVAMVSAPMTNAFMGMATSGILLSETEKYDVATSVVGNLPVIVAIIGVLVIVALYAKPPGGV